MENEKKHELEGAKEQILSEVQAYAKAEYELARLQIINSVSHVVGSLLLTICIILVAFAVISFGASAAVFALSQHLPMWAACLIIGGVYLLMIPLLIGLGKFLFVNPIIKKMSGLKDAEALQYETLRAEGRAAVQRERISAHVRIVQAIYVHYTQLAQTAWNAIRSIFRKK